MKPYLQSLFFLLACAAFGPPRVALAQTCNQTSTLSYRNDTGTTDVEKRAATETISGTSFTAGSYLSGATGATTNDIYALSSTYAAQIDGRALIWRQNNSTLTFPNTTANNGSNNVNTPMRATVTLTFTREVSNLKFRVQDIDKGTLASPGGFGGGSDYTDEFGLYALRADGTRVPLTAADVVLGTNNTNAFVAGQTIDGLTHDVIRGTALNGTTTAPNLAGDVTITFSQPVKSVRLTFRNLNTYQGTTTRLQTLGIEQITWCAQADVATTLAGPTAAVIGSTVTYVATITNNGDDQVTSVRPTVQLPQNLTNVTGGTYVAATGLLTLAAIPNLAADASVTRNITFTMPSTTVTGTVSVPTAGDGSTTAGSSAPDPALANNNGSLANAKVTTIATPPYTISGTVFEDINYGGGLGRSITTANAVTANSAVGVGTAATVELYNATTGAFVASTTTSITAGSLGQYTFANLPGSTSYITRVVNTTVRSTRTGSTAALLGVQTFNGTTDRVGGEAPNLTDAAANTTSANLSTLTPTNGTTAAQSLAMVNLGTANAANIDFGFNFDAVVNTNDTGQGSLRQFVLNANALGGEAALAQRGSRINAAGTTVTLPTGQETSIFMIPSGSAVAGQRSDLASGLTNGVAVINTTTTLTLTGANAANTVIDGTTQTFNIGNTNAGTATNATATTVGVDNVALGGIQQPEVEISGSAATVIDLEAANLTLRGLAAHGGSGQTVLVGNTTASSGYVVENALIGATSDGVRPTTNASAGYGIYVNSNAGVGTVQNSLVAYNGFSGMNVRNGTGTAGTSQFVSNFFVKNGFTQGGGDGITFGDGALSGPANVANNFFTNQNSSALQFEIGTTSATTVTNNTITNSGVVGDAGALVANVEGGGIVYLQRDGTKRGSQADVISKNVITNSQSAGIVVGYGQQNVTISQNNTNGNGGLGIDLINNNTYRVGGNANYGDGDGVTLNDGSSTATAATGVPNKGLDYPIIVSATIVGNTLVVKGYSQPGVTAEFFLRDADTGNFGEGQTYLGGGVENGTGDLNTSTTTLTYSGTINGLNQGTDNSNTARAYTFSLDISTLTTAQLSALTANGVTATATLSTAGTSEFSAKAPVNTAPVPNTLTNVSIPNTNGATVLNPNLSGTANGTLSNGTANSIAYYTVASLPASGTLTYNGIALTTGNIATTQITNPALLTYTPVAGFAGGSVSFTYTATDANGITSTTNNNGGTVTNGPATYTIPVGQVADVTTTLAGPSTLNQGQTTGTYTATFTNNGPNAATGVTQQVTLPTGATLTAAQLTTIQAAYAGTTYNSATRVLYFGGAPVTLANTATNTFNFAFTAPTTTSGQTTLASAVTTTSNQGADAAPNTAALNIQINAAAPNNCAVSYFNNTNSYGGLSADYYSGNYNNTLTYFNTNTPKLKRVDATINFADNNAFGDLATSGVSTTNPAQNYSARYRGSFTITTAGSYTFSSDIDDNLQVWIDGNAVPTTGAPQTTTFTPTQGAEIIKVTGYTNGQASSGAIPLSAGPHNILIFFGAGGGPNNIVFKYSGPDTNNSAVIIPNSVLCAGPSNVPPLAVGNTNANIPNNAGPTTLSPSLAGTDQDGTVTNYAVATLPTAAQGVLRLANGTAVTLNQVITAAQAAGLTFQPTAGFVGNVTFTFSAIDNTGQYSNDVATYTIPVTAAADVTTALTGPATVTPGQPTGTYTATFTNEGSAVANTVTRKVTLPTGATNVVIPTGATISNGVIDFGTANTLASGASSSFNFSFTPAATATGTLNITSNVTTTSSQGADNAPNTSTIAATVAPVADVATTIVATTPTVAAGTLASAGTPPKFTVTFSNNGPVQANGVTASVQLPAGLTNVAITVPTGVTATYNVANGVVTYSGGAVSSVPSGTSVTSVITFDAPGNGPVVASSNISTTTGEAGNTANNKANASIAITPAFDLLTTLTGPASAVAGDLVTLAVTTTNNGPSTAPNAVQTVQLVAGLTNVYVSNGGVYNATGTTKTIVSNGVSYSVPSGGVVFPTLATLPNGQTVANSVSFSQPATAFSPSAVVTPNTTGAGDTNTANNTAYLNSTTTTPLAVATPAAGIANAYTKISSSVASTTVGSPVTLTVITGNNGPNQATSVTQRVQILPGFTAANLQVNGNTGTLNAATNTITFTGATYNTQTGIVTFNTLADGANGSSSATSVSNTITFPAPAATGNNGQLLAMAAVSTTNTDPVPADNVASVGVTLLQSTDLATTITGPASALVGQPVTYTATFTNNGPMTATNVTETAQLPAGLAVNAVTITDAAGNPVAGASYNTITGLVTFPTQTTDLNGAKQVYNITFVAPSQTLVVSSSVNSSSTDAVLTNNTASTTTTMTASADLATTVAGPATAVVGSAVTYSVNTTNNGPSTAINTVTTLQLDRGLTTVSVPNGSYSATTGLVTFNTLASQAPGTTTTNYVTFIMPNATDGQTTGVASATSDVTDPTPSNNTASVATSVAPTTTTSADITAGVTAGSGTAAPGSTIVFTATYGNLGTDPAVNVVPTLQLNPGLTVATIMVANQPGTLSNGLITFPNGAVYSQQTGLVTFPTIASQDVGNNVSYLVNVTAPANGPVVAVAATTSNTSEPNTTAARANDVQSAPVTITPLFDEVTSLSGPASALAGSNLTYVVTTTNNGPSVTTNPTTQTVTLPAGVVPTTGSITNGGVYLNGTITWTIPAGQAAGANGAVANSFTIVQPAGGATVTAKVTVTGESNSGNNSANLNGAATPTATTVPNQAPLAYAVVNTLQGPQSNEYAGLPNGLLISPLNASDPENSFATQKYTIVAAPDGSQGTLYYNDGTTTGAYTAIAAGASRTLTDAQAQTLKFRAATGFTGNASFTYSATDAVGNTSPVVNYTIPVETDVDAVYTVTTPKTSAYANNDVIAFVIDANSAVYNAANAQVYDDLGVRQGGAISGVSSAVAGAFTSSRPGVTSLADLGLTLNPDGRIVVTNPGTIANPNLRSGSYTVSITTTDANGGLTTQVVSFRIPGSPLPVVLTAFTAQAVQNRDALLSWSTASEVNSAYFDVERSLDGTTFTKIGQVAAHGNSTTANTYALTDASIAARANGLVYYRLRQVDRDATAAYSPVRTVAFAKVTPLALSLFPNPAQHATTLDVRALPATGTYQVLVLDATGRTVRTVSVGGGQLQPLNLSDLASGSYQVLVTGTLADGNALRQVLRLTKE